MSVKKNRKKRVRNPMRYDKLIVVHNGALGDFLLIWPALLALSEKFSDIPLYWCGAGEKLPWLAPCGFSFCIPHDAKAIRDMYGARRLPEALRNTRVVWFGMERPPFEFVSDHVWFVPGLEQNTYISPRDLSKKFLKGQGVSWPDYWPEQWRLFFGCREESDREQKRVLLFPGAGHQAKQWPLVKFFELEQRLRQRGCDTRFVLGPVEVERGLFSNVGNEVPVLAPKSLAELATLLQGADCVLGNDCGPMHLASMMGTPGLALFGPTSRRQWQPRGLRAYAQEMPCRPCTRTTADICCATPRCIHDIEVDEVEKAAWECLLGA